MITILFESFITQAARAEQICTSKYKSVGLQTLLPEGRGLFVSVSARRLRPIPPPGKAKR